MILSPNRCAWASFGVRLSPVCRAQWGESERDAGLSLLGFNFSICEVGPSLWLFLTHTCEARGSQLFLCLPQPVATSPVSCPPVLLFHEGPGRLEGQCPEGEGVTRWGSSRSEGAGCESRGRKQPRGKCRIIHAGPCPTSGRGVKGSRASRSASS